MYRTMTVVLCIEIEDGFERIAGGGKRNSAFSLHELGRLGGWGFSGWGADLEVNEILQLD